jgi:hypothetical protein
MSIKEEINGNRKAELKVYTDFGKYFTSVQKMYEIYDPAHRLKPKRLSAEVKTG